MSQALYLVDGTGYVFRAYYGIRPLSTSTGIPTQAVLGFGKMLLKLIKDHAPSHLGMAFDPKGPTFRNDMYAEYKANREEAPDDLKEQIPLVAELTEAWGIPILARDGFEADDTLATLARKAAATGHQVVVVTGDKDLMQLVNDQITLYDPMKDKVYDREAVIEKQGVPPESVADLLALAGDTSDNIPGVPKVGPKTAAKLIGEFGDVEAIIEGLSGRDKLKAAERSVIDNAESARLSKRLTLVCDTVPIDLDLDALRYQPPNAEALRPLLKRLEAFSLIRDLGVDGDSTPAAPSPKEADPSEPNVDGDSPELPVPAIDHERYETILDLDALDAVLAVAKKRKQLVFDLETTSLDPQKADIVGVALCVGAGRAYYVPVGHIYLGCPKQLAAKDVLKRLKAVFADPDIVKIAHNLKYDTAVLQRVKIGVPEPYRDSMLTAYVLDPGRLGFGMDALARDLFGIETIKYSDVCGTGKKQIPFSEVPLDEATRYAAEDAEVTWHLDAHLQRRLEGSPLQKLCETLELPLLKVLLAMETEGIQVDTDALRDLGEEFSQRLATIQQGVEDEIGESINLASPKQLGALFFDKLGYPVIKKTKTGYSTDAEVLETLAKSYELPGKVLAHRGLSKLRSTYIDALLELTDPESGRVHTRYNQTGAATGRLSSSDPNLQNIPIRSEDGRRIRAVFIAKPGHRLLAADYSQVELRIMAHLADDPSFIEAFERGEDIHERTAREVLTEGGPVESEHRRRAKAINFGVLYGLSEFGLARQLDIPRAEAREFIQRYFGRYPNIRHYLDRTIEEAKESGYVSTLFGRRRLLPDLKHKNQNIRRHAERIAMNTPIQGSAADIIKQAMLEIDAAIQKGKLGSRMLLQVHDELVFEAPEAEIESLSELVRAKMSGVVELKVPLTVEIGVGHSWSEAH